MTIIQVYDKDHFKKIVRNPKKCDYNLCSEITLD